MLAWMGGARKRKRMDIVSAAIHDRRNHHPPPRPTQEAAAAQAAVIPRPTGVAAPNYHPRRPGQPLNGFTRGSSNVGEGPSTDPCRAAHDGCDVPGPGREFESLDMPMDAVGQRRGSQGSMPPQSLDLVVLSGRGLDRKGPEGGVPGGSKRTANARSPASASAALDSPLPRQLDSGHHGFDLKGEEGGQGSGGNLLDASIRGPRGDELLGVTLGLPKRLRFGYSDREDAAAEPMAEEDLDDAQPPGMGGGGDEDEANAKRAKSVDSRLARHRRATLDLPSLLEEEEEEEEEEEDLPEEEEPPLAGPGPALEDKDLRHLMPPTTTTLDPLGVAAAAATAAVDDPWPPSESSSQQGLSPWILMGLLPHPAPNPRTSASLLTTKESRKVPFLPLGPAVQQRGGAMKKSKETMGEDPLKGEDRSNPLLPQDQDKMYPVLQAQPAPQPASSIPHVGVQGASLASPPGPVSGGATAPPTSPEACGPASTVLARPTGMDDPERQQKAKKKGREGRLLDSAAVESLINPAVQGTDRQQGPLEKPGGGHLCQVLEEEPQGQGESLCQEEEGRCLRKDMLGHEGKVSGGCSMVLVDAAEGSLTLDLLKIL